MTSAPSPLAFFPLALACAAPDTVVDWPDEPERPDRVHLPCRPPQVEDVVTRQEQDASSLEPRVLRQPAPISPAEPGVNGEGWVAVRSGSPAPASDKNDRISRWS
jgi:hypothetical protein